MVVGVPLVGVNPSGNAVIAALRPIFVSHLACVSQRHCVEYISLYTLTSYPVTRAGRHAPRRYAYRHDDELSPGQYYHRDHYVRVFICYKLLTILRRLGFYLGRGGHHTLREV